MRETEQLPQAEQRHISKFAVARRRLMHTFLSPVLATEIQHQERLVEMSQFVGRGKGGVLIVEHKSQREGMEAGRFSLEDREMITREMLIPIAYHMKALHINTYAAFGSTKLSYLYTEETVEKFKEKKEKTVTNEQIRDAQTSYINQIAEVVLGGGVAIVFYQGSRKKTLYDPRSTSEIRRDIENKDSEMNQPIQSENNISQGILRLIDLGVERLAQRKHVEKPNFGVAAVSVDMPKVAGMSVSDEQFLEERKWFHIGDKTTYNLGHTHSIQELDKRSMTREDV